MEVLIYVAAFIGVFILGAWAYNRPYLRRVTAQRVLVHSTTDETFEGLLTGTYPDGITLDTVSLVRTSGSVEIAGTVFIPRPKVKWMQTSIYVGSEED